MFRFSASTPVKAAAVGVLTIGVLFVAPSAFAETSTSGVTQAVDGGGRSATVTGPTLTAVPVSHTATASSGALSLAVDDLSGTGAGWQVTKQVGAFAYTAGGNSGATILASAFSVTAGTASTTNGADMTGVAVGAGGALDTARVVLSATAGNGVGAYALASTGTLTVPANARAGTYTATLTTTITAAL